MKVWIWAILILALLLVLWSFRERFEDEVLEELIPARCADGTQPLMSDGKCSDSGTFPRCPANTELYTAKFNESTLGFKCVPASRLYEPIETDKPFPTTSELCGSSTAILAKRTDQPIGELRRTPSKCVRMSASEKIPTKESFVGNTSDGPLGPGEYISANCPEGGFLSQRSGMCEFIGPRGMCPTGMSMTNLGCKLPNSEHYVAPRCSDDFMFNTQMGFCTKPSTPPSCPDGYALMVPDRNRLRQCFKPSPNAPPPGPTGPSGETTDSGEPPLPPNATRVICPPGSRFKNANRKCVYENASTPAVEPTCPAGNRPRPDDAGFLRCFPFNMTPAEEAAARARVEATRAAAGGATTNTTGGSSAAAAAAAAAGVSSPPTGVSRPQFSGMDLNRNPLLGPLFTGYGVGGKPGVQDTTKQNVYPELLGGLNQRGRSLAGGAGGAGAGVAGGGFGIGFGGAGGAGGAGGDAAGALPTSAGLGSDEASRFFPTSRQPGDMELIPDPYRVSQQFSAASYSSKTEPAPFLADFSAFQK